MARPLHLIYQPTVATAGFHRDRRMRRKLRQKLAIKLAIVSHTQRLAGLTFLIHRHKDGKLLVTSHPINCSILLQHLLVLGVSLAVYAKPRCSAFIASLSVTMSWTVRLEQTQGS